MTLAGQLEILRVRMIAQAEADSMAVRTLASEVEAMDESLRLDLEHLIASHKERRLSLIEDAAAFVRQLVAYQHAIEMQKGTPPLEYRQNYNILAAE